MIGTQRVRLANGNTRVYRDVAEFRYTNSPPHHHWHAGELGSDSFELRTLDGRTLVRDRKSGFCLADQLGLRAGLLSRPSSGLPRRLRAVPSGGEER